MPEILSQIQAIATRIGRDLLEKVLQLFFAANQPQIPVWAKSVIYSALVYLVLPMDAIPDIIPITGYVDDVSTIAAALSAVAFCINDDVRQRARQTVDQWLGATN